jgi:hypothetical protein
MVSVAIGAAALAVLLLLVAAHSGTLVVLVREWRVGLLGEHGAGVALVGNIDIAEVRVRIPPLVGQ